MVLVFVLKMIIYTKSKYLVSKKYCAVSTCVFLPYYSKETNKYCKVMENKNEKISEEVKNNVAVEEMAEENPLDSEKVMAEIESKAKELKAADPKLKKVFPIMVLGNEEEGEKPYYVAYFKRPNVPAFSKFMSLSQKDMVGALRELAKDCYVDGDRELVKDDDLFTGGLMPHLQQIMETRQGKLVNLSKAGK